MTSVRLRWVLVGFTLVALAVRLVAAVSVDFGDSEALYASYALFPAPAYVDHPALIGLVARALGHGLAPSPFAAHVFTAFAMSAAPWAVLLAARVLGAELRASLLAAVAVAMAPEVAVGLFGLTPDLLLFFAWIATLAAFGRGLRSLPGSNAAAACFTAAGLALSVGCASKVSALTLAVALAVTLASKNARAHATTPWPWATFGIPFVALSPVLAFEAHTGWPMLRHRLVETQIEAGASLRNLGAILGGQALYVSPGLAVAGLLLGRELWRRRSVDAVHTLLAMTTLAPAALLGTLCLWSKVAEPHWLAPAWLALPLYFATRTPEEGETAPVGPKLARTALALGLAFSSVVYAWVLIPSLVTLVPKDRYDPRLDLANELTGWPEVASEVARAAEEIRLGYMNPDAVAVVGPVWMVSAQLRAALPSDIAVGCVGPNAADFPTWMPRSVWSRADVVIFVHDNRAPADSAALFPDRVRTKERRVTIERGGRTARVFTVELLEVRAAS